MMTHRERLHSCLAGETPDRPPVALWRHSPVDDQSPETLAAAALHWQKTYDFDFVKVTPASSFCLKDWGVEDIWEGHIEGTRRYTHHVITRPEDWEHLPELDVSAPYLSAQLACLDLIRAKLDFETPLVQTVFSPLAQAKNLAGSETLLAHLRTHPEVVLKGLEVITNTTRRFVETVIGIGVDGIFYAIQHAQASLLSSDEYRSFGLPFDQRVLEPAKSLWLNMLHLHGKDVHFSIVPFLPFPIVNWHDRETAPSLSEAQKIFNGVVCGGLRQDTLVYQDSNAIRGQAADAISQTHGKRIILSTGCVVPVIAPHGNLIAARESVEL